MSYGDDAADACADDGADGDGDGGHDGDGDVGQEDDSNAGLIWVRDAAIVSRELFAIAPTARGPGPYSGL